jgi:hypothetical protein
VANRDRRGRLAGRKDRHVAVIDHLDRNIEVIREIEQPLPRLTADGAFEVGRLHAGC